MPLATLLSLRMHSSSLRSRRSLFASAVFVAIVCGAQSLAHGQRHAPAGTLTIYTPDPISVSLALDELAVERPAAAISTTDRRAARPSPLELMTVSPVIDVRSLENLRQAEASRTAGTRAFLVVYERGAVRSNATRQLLTPDVAVLLEPGTTPDVILRGVGGRRRPIRGVQNAYVLEFSDTLHAIEQVTALRARAGVRQAYSLVKRQRFAR